LIIELRKQVADLNSSNLALTTEVSGLKNQVNKLNGQVADLTTENGDLKGQVTNLREDNGNLQSNITSLNEQLVESDRIAKTPFVHDWVYTPNHGWLHIDPQNFPIIYKNDTQTWHFYEQGSINPRYFYNFNQQKWEAWDPTE
jgi:regulator of replication initiation timing